MADRLVDKDAGPLAGPVCLVATLAISEADAAPLDALLLPSERDGIATIRETGQRLRHIASTVLTRALLAHSTGTCADIWTVEPDRNGAPQALRHGVPHPITVSRARADGLVAAAVSFPSEVGIDVEALAPQGADDALARQFFSPEERQWLYGRSGQDRIEGFFRLWTLKEAYIKARGLGFGIPLDGFSLIPAADHVTFAPPADDRDRRWHFVSTTPTARHRLALAYAAECMKPEMLVAQVDTAGGTLRFQRGSELPAFAAGPSSPSF